MLGDHYVITKIGEYGLDISAARVRNRHHKAKHTLAVLQHRFHEEQLPVIRMHFRMRGLQVRTQEITATAGRVTHQDSWGK